MRTRCMVIGPLLLLGCNSTGVGNPPVAHNPPVDTSPDVTRVAITSDESAEIDGLFLPQGSFATAVVNIREFAAVPCDRSEPVQRFVGPFEVDLKRADSFALPDLVNTESGICSLRLNLAEGDADALYPGEWLHAEASFDDYRVTIALRGSLDLVLQTRSNTPWGLLDADPAPADAEPAASVIIALQPERWLTRLEVLLRANAEGELVVNESAPILAAAVRLRLKKSTTILRDLDGDRVIDAIERGLEQILALGE